MTNMAKEITVNIAEAKAQFSRLVRKAMMGEEVIIARDNKPLLKLVPIAPSDAPRTPGSAKGRVWTSPDFDATPDDFSDYI
jgi:prevent-host-death family protein